MLFLMKILQFLKNKVTNFVFAKFFLFPDFTNSEISRIYQSKQVFEKYYNFFCQNNLWTNQNNSGLSNGNSEVAKQFIEIYLY